MVVEESPVVGGDHAHEAGLVVLLEGEAGAGELRGVLTGVMGYLFWGLAGMAQHSGVLSYGVGQLPQQFIWAQGQKGGNLIP